MVKCWCCGGVIELLVSQIEGTTLLTHSIPSCTAYQAVETSKDASDYFERCTKDRADECS